MSNKTLTLSLIAVAVAATVLSTKAFAAEVKLPADLPSYGQDKPLPVPQIAKRTLSNGLQIWVVPRDGLPRVDYVLAVRGAGFGADDPALCGFASLLADVMNEGTAKLDSRAIAEAAQALGGEIGAAASNDGITVFANALTSNAKPMLALLAEIARNPSYPDKEVELAKANALQSLKAAEARPSFRAERALSQAIFGDHPYGHTQASVTSINATTPELLRAEHDRRFRADRALLVITGRIGEAEALQMAQAAFGDWDTQGQPLAALARAPTAAAPRHLLLERPGSVQSTLRLGRPAESASAADYVPLRLVSTILGGGISSRLNQNLREAKGWTYGASAGARAFRDGGSIVGGADVRNAVTGDSLKEFLAEYTRIGTELVPADELSMDKRYVAGSYLIGTQRQGTVARTLASNWLIGLPPEFLGEFVPLVQKVTAQQVRETGKKYFAPETQSIVVVGDKALVAQQLKAFGEFTVLEK